MDEDGEETPRTPFWIQSTKNVRRIDLYRNRVSTLFFNSGVLIIFLLFLAIISMLFIIPSFISFTSNIFKPHLVKKSWDSINLVLVLFALAFGFLSRNINNNVDQTQTPRFDDNINESHQSRSHISNTEPALVSLAQQEWYDFPEQPIVGLRRHRSTSSYPDLRELHPPAANTGAPWRFSDDTHLTYDRYYFRQELQDFGIKDVVHDGMVVGIPKGESFAPVALAPVVEDEPMAAPEPLPPPPAKRVVRTYHSVAKQEVETGSTVDINEEKKSPENDTKLPENEIKLPEFRESNQREEKVVKRRGKGERRRARSSEPRKRVVEVSEMVTEPEAEVISPEIQDFKQENKKLERKRSGVNATKEFFTSFYLKKKKKRQRHKSVDNLDSFLQHSHTPENVYLPPPSTPPPPPPMPPPPSVVNNLFSSKKERRKKLLSTIPPPPPPLPRPRSAACAPKPTTTTTRVAPFVTEKPWKPVKMSFFNGIDDSSSGGESPMCRIPPPPPMPPFKMPDWKFAVEGDYVRVQSTLSSGNVSPTDDESRSPSSAVASPVFCPSPDVDTKADTFIARFRAGLKLEKANSFNQNQRNRMSNLGPGPGPSRSYRL